MMKKRILSAILAVAMLLTFIPAFAAEDMTVTIGTVEFAEGATEVDVPVTLSGNVGVGLMELYIKYDNTALTYVSGTIGDVFTTADAAVEEANGLVSFAAIANDLVDKTADGTLFTMKFAIKDGAAAGTYALELDGNELVGNCAEYDYTSETIFVEGSIKIPAPSYTYAETKFNNGALEVAYDVADNYASKLVVVAYSNGGKRLEKAVFVDVTKANADTAINLAEAIGSVTNATSYKAMLWVDDVNCQPLLDAIGW